MKYLLNSLLVLTIVGFMGSCSPDDTGSDRTPTSCHVTFDPLLSDETVMAMSPAFTEEVFLYAYHYRPLAVRRLISVYCEAALPPGASDCRIEGDTQIWESSFGGLYSYQEIQYLETRTNAVNIGQFDSTTDLEHGFWEMNDHSEGGLVYIDRIENERIEIDWINNNGDISIILYGYLNEVLIETETATYNADGSGSYEFSDDINTENITWNVNGTGTYANQNDPSLNRTF